MERFYFDVRANGELQNDERGRKFSDLRQACAYALRATPLLLKKSMHAANTYVTTEITDDHRRTVCVIRGTIITETR